MSYFERFPVPTKPKARNRWDLTDAAILLGLALALAGIALVSGPAAVIAAGVALVALGIFLSH
jgi:hypothetical protein